MAVTFEVKHTRGTVYLFNPADVVINASDNGRHDLPDITDEASILEHGQQQPVAVRIKIISQCWLWGFPRWRAVAELNQEYPNGKLSSKRFNVRLTRSAGCYFNHEGESPAVMRPRRLTTRICSRGSKATAGSIKRLRQKMK